MSASKEGQIITAKKTFFLSDELTIFRSHEVREGGDFGTKIFSDILKSIENLEDVGDVLVEENAMLEGAIRLSEKKIKVEERIKFIMKLLSERKSPQQRN